MTDTVVMKKMHVNNISCQLYVVMHRDFPTMYHVEQSRHETALMNNEVVLFPRANDQILLTSAEIIG